MADGPLTNELYGMLGVDNEFFMREKLYRMCFCLLMMWASIGCVVADTSCDGYDPNKHPSHYCDCRNFTHLSRLPFDVMVNDSIWFDCSSNLFTNGFTAYLYSDCDVQFDIYQNCKSTAPLYRVTIPKGQARDVTAESIKQKLEEAGYGGMSMTIYLCIYPVGGTGGRLMCYPYNMGYNSTCNDILALLPGMTFVSSHAEDVYELLPENIADSYAMYMECDMACRMEITRGACDGEPIVEYDFTTEESRYHFDKKLLMDVRAKGERLYVHFSHDGVGRISLNEAEFVDVLTDTTICRGKEFRYGDFVTTESGVYRYDTVELSLMEYHVYGYNILFAEPETQYDTLALRNNQLPYSYRGEVIDTFGDYEWRFVADGECDELVRLNVYHNRTTITVVKDTTICYGGRFDYEGGGSYDYDVTLKDSTWNISHDTLTINIINVYFNTQDFAYDTLALTKKQAENYRYAGTITIKGFGDYEYNKYDNHNCPVTVYLHVKHKVTYIDEVIDTTLCDGEVYKHTDGLEYRASVELVDSGWVDDDTYRVAKTNVRFITNELMYDTLYLSYADLPYRYKDQAIINAVGDTTVDILFGKCTGQVLLHIVHKFERVTAEENVTLCEGRVYEYNGEKYREETIIKDSLWVDRDTFLVKTIRVQFTAPDVVYDTIALKASELPHLYREQYVIPADGFGVHDVTIRNEGECDERISLLVEHRTDTVEVVNDTTICEGKAYVHNNGEVYDEYVEIVDSAWKNVDTMVVTTTRVYFAAPEVQYDTIELRFSVLPYVYREQYEVNEFGSHDVTIRNEGECDEFYRLSVYHKIDTVVTVRDSVICYGGRYEYEKDGKNYITDRDISFGSQLVLNEDSVLIDTLHVRFETKPDVVYDTIVLTASQLPYKYSQYYPQNKVSKFGDYYWEEMINIATRCKENVNLHVAQLTTQTIDTTVCEGDVYVHNGVEYTQPTTLVDSAWVDAFNFQITTTRVSFKTIETQYDTVAIRTTDLPYDYRGEQIAGFGEHDLIIETIGECDERILLSVIHLTTTVTVEKDTVLCEGKVFEYNEDLYSESATIIDSAWVNQDTLLISTINLTFDAPMMEYDTVFVTAGELSGGYYYELADEYIYSSGEYNYEIVADGECTRKISLMVVRNITTEIDDSEVVEVKSKLIMIDGVIYILHNGEYYTLMGEKVGLLNVE